MNKYEKLLDQVNSEIPVYEENLQELVGAAGLYRNGKIYLEKSKTMIEKAATLAEEYGHYKLTVGNILDYNNPKNWKEEWKARRYAIEALVSLDDLLKCALNGFHTKCECAEFLEVTTELIADSLVHYFTKYGTSHYHRNYQFFFNNDSIRVHPVQKFG